MAESAQEVIRKALLNEDRRAWLDFEDAGEMVADIEAALSEKGLLLEAEPNHLIVSIPVVQEYESGDWESCTPGYWYATATQLRVLLDTLEDKVAASFGFEMENGDPFPDGFDSLTKHLLKKYEPQMEAAMEEAKKTSFPLKFL